MKRGIFSPETTPIVQRTYVRFALKTQGRTICRAIFYEESARTPATPEPIKNWSMKTLKEKLIKTGARVVSHGRYVAFQMV